jgi:DNA anti-recombination protein RmuC
VMAYCAELQKDFARFKDDFEVVGKHLGNAHARFADAEKRLDRFETKLERASEQQPELGDGAAELPRALDAA